jgi:hypothetical protein
MSYDDPGRVYPPRKYLLYKKLLADHNISDGQRDLIGKMLAEEEAKLLNLFSPQGRETAKGLNPSPSVQPENPA